MLPKEKQFHIDCLLQFFKKSQHIIPPKIHNEFLKLTLYRTLSLFLPKQTNEQETMHALICISNDHGRIKISKLLKISPCQF